MKLNLLVAALVLASFVLDVYAGNSGTAVTVCYAVMALIGWVASAINARAAGYRGWFS